MSKSEDTRYFRYANRLRGPNLFCQFLLTPREAAGKWVDERIDPGEYWGGTLWVLMFFAGIAAVLFSYRGFEAVATALPRRRGAGYCR